MKKTSSTIWRCAVFAALTLLVGNIAQPQNRGVDSSRKLDEFTGPNWENAMAHLDNFVVSLANNPNDIGVIIVYGGSRGRRGEARAWSACIRDYLISRRRFEAGRLIVMDGGYRQSLTAELWETTDKNHVPAPSAQIKLKNVRFRKGTIGGWRKMCAL